VTSGSTGFALEIVCWVLGIGFIVLFYGEIERRQRLPDAAGPLPLLTLAGLVSLLGGFGPAIRRRFRRD
jgi:hypothetical protein